MKKTYTFAAAALSAAMILCPVMAYAESPVEEQETSDALELEEEKSGGWLDSLKGLLNEGGEAVSGIFGKGGIIENALPDQEQVDQALSDIKDGFGVMGAGIKDGMGEIGSGLGGLLGGLVDGLFGGGEGSGGWELFFEQTGKMKEAGKAYMLEVNAPLMEPGDVQIIADGAVTDSGIKNGVGYSIVYFMQQNFTEDEDHMLHFLCEKNDLVFFEFHETEDGGFEIADAEFLEAGDSLEESLKDYLSLVSSDTVDECRESIIFAELYVLPETLMEYLDENPEIAGIEYKGEMRTSDELKALRDKQTWEYYGIYEDESEEVSEAESETE